MDTLNQHEIDRARGLLTQFIDATCAMSNQRRWKSLQNRIDELRGLLYDEEQDLVVAENRRRLATRNGLEP